MGIAIIESLLFVAGDDGLSLEELSKLTGFSLEEIDVLINELQEKYNEDPGRGITLLETAHKFQLVTKSKYADYVKKYAQSPFSQTLSKALLETLAIVAYKQPITRIEIEEIRGVQVTNNLQKLRSRQLIQEVGKLDKPGQPLLYGTTKFFLDYFGINNIEELPELTENNGEQDITNLFSRSFDQAFEEIEKDTNEET